MYTFAVNNKIFLKDSSGETNRSVPLIKAGCDMNQQHHITTTLMGGTVDFVKPVFCSVRNVLLVNQLALIYTTRYIYAHIAWYGIMSDTEYIKRIKNKI